MKFNLTNFVTFLGGCLFLGAIAIGLTTQFRGLIPDCSAGDDTCIERRVEELRNERGVELAKIDEQLATWTKTRNDTETRYNDRIKAMKKKATAEWIIKQSADGKRENIPEELLSLKSLLVPSAHAATGETITMNDSIVVTAASEGGVRFGDVIPVGRYGKVLADLGSPYANVPIEQYCNKAGVKEYLCDVLVGITWAESNAGLNFRCNWKSSEEAKQLGQNYYHNPAGYKDFTNDGKQKNPDENGCYLRKFDSWESFWEFYTAKMKTGYFDKGATTAASISRWYVGGDGAVKIAWVSRVLFVVDQIKKANS